MSAAYVLIVAVWMTGAGGYVVTMQPFSTKETCVAAAAVVDKMTEDSYRTYVKTECVPR